MTMTRTLGRSGIQVSAVGLGALLVFCLAAYYVPAAMRVIRHRLDARRNAYLASEGWSFDQFRAAARRR